MRVFFRVWLIVHCFLFQVWKTGHHGPLVPVPVVVDIKQDTEDVHPAREPVARSRLNVERAIILFVKVQFYYIMSYSREHQASVLSNTCLSGTCTRSSQSQTAGPTTAP